MRAAGIKGSSWPRWVLEGLDWHKRHEFRAAFVDLDDALYYAWTHPAHIIVSTFVYLDVQHHSVFARRLTGAPREAP